MQNWGSCVSARAARCVRGAGCGIRGIRGGRGGGDVRGAPRRGDRGGVGGVRRRRAGGVRSCGGGRVRGREEVAVFVHAAPTTARIAGMMRP
jgi:hypothetical protein